MTMAEDTESTSAAEPVGPAGSASAPAPESNPEPPRESLVDAIADLLQMFVDWIRSEANDLVRDKLVLPMQQLGLTVASASAAGCLVVIGLCFIFVAILLLLAQWLGWPGALLLVGGLILAGAGIFTYIKMRSMQ